MVASPSASTGVRASPYKRNKCCSLLAPKQKRAIFISTATSSTCVSCRGGGPADPVSADPVSLLFQAIFVSAT
eukprot:3204225-Lingulodinium_polyedra.AAC.1